MLVVAHERGILLDVAQHPAPRHVLPFNTHGRKWRKAGEYCRCRSIVMRFSHHGAVRAAGRLLAFQRTDEFHFKREKKKPSFFFSHLPPLAS